MNNEHIAQLEALLFAYGEPINSKKIGELMEISQEEVTVVIDGLKKTLENDERGLALMEHDDMIQLITKPSYDHIIRKLIKTELREELTPAAQETLALIAYGGPILKTKIEYIRGVNSSFILRNLEMRGLIKKIQGEGRGYCYQITMEFIRHLGLQKINDLPDYEMHRQTIIAANTSNM